MSFWKRIGVFLGGASSRIVGLQSGSPSRYDALTAVPVTVDSAMQVSAAWACVRLTAETIASLKIKIWDVDPKTGVRTENKDHPLAILFANRVNRWQTRQEFFETIGFQNVLLGNSYSVKQFNSQKKLIGLVPLMSEQMAVVLQDDMSLLYNYTDGRQLITYQQEEIWHNKLLGNGVIGLNPLSYARHALGIAQGAEQATTKIYKNGGKPSGVLTIDKVLTPEQRKAVKDNFSELAQGNDDRLFALEAGMKYQQVSLSPQDIELLSSRKFQVEDIARFYGVPSVLINDTGASTAWGTGVETIIQGWYKLGLRPYLTRMASSMKINLLSAAERQNMDITFELDELLQPAWADRVTSGKNAIQGGMITPNEWRSEEGKPPLEGGDSLLVQQQMVALEQLDKIPRGGATNNAQQDSGQEDNAGTKNGKK